MTFIAEVRKAIAAGLAAGLATYTTAVASGPLTQTSWSLIVGSVVVAAALVFFVPNQKPATP